MAAATIVIDTRPVSAVEKDTGSKSQAPARIVTTPATLAGREARICAAVHASSLARVLAVRIPAKSLRSNKIPSAAYLPRMIQENT